MPGVQKKDLYLAKSIGELNKFADVTGNQISTNNPKLLLRSADKMMKEAELQDSLGDEERAYVLFMKYFNVITILKKTADYRKQKEYYDNLIGKKNVIKAISKAEELSHNIKERYDLREAKMVADKLAHLDEKINGGIKVEDKDEALNKKTNSLKSENDDTSDVNETKKDEQSNQTPWSSGEITPTQLHSLLSDKSVEMVIMDVRPEDQYKTSHIKHDCCINVPADIVPAGTTITYIEKALPEESRSGWQRRGQLDHIVLMDWNSTKDKVTIGTTLRTLKDALFKYDSTVIIKSEPLVLEGGYDQWLLHYPQLTTNALVERPKFTETASPIPSLDFDYPDFDEAFILTPTPKSAPNQNQTDTLNNQSGTSSQNSGIDLSSASKNLYGPINGSLTSVPRIDRSNKPKPLTQKSLDNRTNGGVNLNSSDKSDSLNSSLYPSVPLASTKGNTPVVNVKPEGDLVTGRVTTSYSSSSLSNFSGDIENERQELERIRKQKEEELLNFQREKERISLEHQARIQRLRAEEDKIEKLDKLRQEQTKDVADLMRMKKRLQEEIQQETKKNEEVERQKELEEMTKKKELMIVLEKEKQRQVEVERLRLERKKKEEIMKNDELEMMDRDKAEKEALSRARERARQEEANRQKELKLAEEKAEQLRKEEARQVEEEAKLKNEEEKRKELARLEEQKRKQELELRRQHELEYKKQQELEMIKQKEAEQKRLQDLEQKRQQELKERLEQEKLEAERKERERKDKEAAEQAKAEQARQEAEEKIRRMNAQENRMRAIPSPNLPSGWEKRLDPATRRYYYINHRAGTTQWEPPEATARPSTSAHQVGTYTARLKDEPTEPKRGLSRSHSSPNIAKLIEEEEKERQMTPKLPSVDRSKKPEQRREHIPEILRPSPQKQAQRFRNLNPVFGNVGRALTGLRNLGNTCYMNSIIQCLNNTSPLVTYFITDAYLYDVNRENELGSHGEVAEEFAVIVKALWSGSYRCITPKDFKWMVGKHQPMFAGHEQQDSQEFLTFLLDGLHEGLNKVKTRPKIPEQENDNIPDYQAADIAWKHHKLLNESIIVELFQGQLKSTLMCLTCRKQSVTYQAFMYLSLPIPTGSRCTLQNCITQFLKEEKMTGSSRWRCPRCKRDRDSIKKIDIWKLPRLLLIGLNRFVYEGQWREKINSYVDFSVKGLDLNPYILGPKNNRNTYNLYGISNHYGTMDGGHYTAYCRNPCTQRWYKYDDSDVYEMSSSDIKTSAAFVLFYTSIELTPPALPQLF